MIDIQLATAATGQLIVGCVTAGLVTAGAAVALWRFVLQAPLGNKYAISLSDCRLRRLARAGQPAYAYSMCLTVENRSATIQQVHGWWRRIVLPSEGGPGYDPDGHLNIESDEEANDRLGPEQGYTQYSLMPGEELADQMVRVVVTPPEEICYVEYVLKYRKWCRGFGIALFRRRDFEYRSQIMVAPVEREDIRDIIDPAESVGNAGGTYAFDQPTKPNSAGAALEPATGSNSSEGGRSE